MNFPSLHIALSGLSGRPGRSALLATAVLLASALVVAVACGVGSIRRAVEVRLERVIGATDARIVEENGNRFDAALVEQVQKWPGVVAAGARLFSSITVVNERAAGRPARLPRSAAGPNTPAAPDAPARANLQVRGIDLETLERFGQVDLSEGRLPQRDDELLLDPMARATLRAELGDTLRLQRFGSPMHFTVVGFYGRPALGMLQRSEAVLPRRALEEATGRVGEANVVSMILEDGIDVAAWCAENQPQLAAGLSLEPAEMITTGYDRQVRAGNITFLLGSVIAFLSCSFIVATGMTTAVVEQERLMGMMRAIGASRGQLFRSQLLHGAILCGAGGLLGVPLGIALAWLLVRSLREWMPDGLAVEPMGFALALGGSLAAGIAGALYPAWRATRVSPLAALAARAQPPTARGMALCAGAGMVCVLAQLALLLLPDAQQRFWGYVVVGLPLLHIGWFLLSPPLLLAASTLLAAPLSRLLALPRGLLRGTMLATPFRAGFTAGALMVGVSILVSTWSNGRSLLDDWVGRIRFADGFVFRVTGISPAEQERITDLPFVQSACPIGYLPLRVVGEARLGVHDFAPPNVVCVGFDPERFFAMTTLDWHQGDPATAIPALARGEGVLVAEQFLVARGLGVGDTLRLASGSREHEFKVIGVVSAAGMDIATQWFGIRSAYLEHAMSCVFMDFKSVGALYGSTEATMMQLSLDPEISDDEVSAAIGDTVPGVLFSSGRAIKALIAQIGTAMLGATTGVAIGALLLGCFGVGNVIAAGVHARRHEFGVLRAVGGSRWLPARLVCAEAALMAVGGAISGTLLGLHLAWVSVVLHRALVGIPMRLVVPFGPTAAGWATVIALAVLAALPAAWMLARRSPRELLGARG